MYELARVAFVTVSAYEGKTQLSGVLAPPGVAGCRRPPGFTFTITLLSFTALSVLSAIGTAAPIAAVRSVSGPPLCFGCGNSVVLGGRASTTVVGLHLFIRQSLGDDVLETQVSSSLVIRFQVFPHLNLQLQLRGLLQGCKQDFPQLVFRQLVLRVGQDVHVPPVEFIQLIVALPLVVQEILKVVESL